MPRLGNEVDTVAPGVGFALAPRRRSDQLQPTAHCLSGCATSRQPSRHRTYATWMQPPAGCRVRPPRRPRDVDVVPLYVRERQSLSPRGDLRHNTPKRLVTTTERVETRRTDRSSSERASLNGERTTSRAGVGVPPPAPAQCGAIHQEWGGHAAGSPGGGPSAAASGAFTTR
jgi:hypothetical protein